MSSRLVLFATHATGMVLGFFVTVILSRALGASGYGYYSLAFMGVTLLSVPLGRGWGTLILRTVGRIGDRTRWQDTAALLRRGRQLSIYYALGVSCAILLVLWYTDFEVAWWIAPVFGLLLVVRQNSAFAFSLMRGVGFPVAGQLASMVIQPAFLGILLLLSLTQLSRGMRWTDAFLILFASSLVAYLFSFVTQRHLVDSSMLQVTTNDRAVSKQWILSAGIIGSNTFLMTFFSQVDSYVLAAFTDSTAVGLYRVSVQCAALGGFVYTVLNFLAAAQLSAAWAAGQLEQIETISSRYSLLSVLFVFVCLGIMGVAGSVLVETAFGSEFASAVPLILILLLGQVVNAAVGMPAQLLTMSGHETELMKRTVVAVLVNAGLAVLLVPKFGAYGAAVANVGSVTYLNLAYYWVTRRQLGVEMAVWGRRL